MLIKQVKGDAEQLDGRIIAYCQVEMETPPDSSKNPLAGMIRNNLLSIKADYRESWNFSQFLKKDMGEDIRAGVEDLLDKLGIENAGDQVNLEKIMHRLESMKDLGVYIPTPARFADFESAAEAQAQPGDVFDLGAFRNLANANFCLNAIPILYQAMYREQQSRIIKKEIDALLEGISSRAGAEANWREAPGEVQRRLTAEYLPAIFYAAHDERATQAAGQKLRDYLAGYRFPEDVETIIGLTHNHDLDRQTLNLLLELWVKKISAVIQDDFEAAAKYQNKIKEISGR